METNRKLFKRDISWLSFNYRVLMEAKDESLPLFERIKFLSIYSSNLEEFYRIRVSEHRKAIADPKSTEEEKANAYQTLSDITTQVAIQLKEFDSFFQNDILDEMARQKIVLYRDSNIEKYHIEYIRTYFREEVFPFLEPMIILNGLVNTFLRDNRLYMAIRMYKKLDPFRKPYYFIMKVPYQKVPRFIELPQINDTHYLIFVEDMIKYNLDQVFPGFDIDAAYNIRVSRDADFFLSSENRQTIVEEIRKSVRKRKIGVANRFVYDINMPQDFLDYLCESLLFSKDRCIPEGHHLSLQDLINMPNPIGKRLSYENPSPLRIRDFDNSRSVFKVIKKRDMLIHLPYQSFEYFIRFLNEAAFDPDVEEIKLTQYRVASNSDVINSLISASANGKRVTVFVEIKARFDEENNFVNAEKMRKAGIRIIYSLPGLKVHSKMALVLRKTESGSLDKSYACMSTGNFNEKTACQYSDLLILTNRIELITEMDILFDMLENGIHPYEFRHIMVSQFNMVEALRSKFDKEIENAKSGKRARIILKMNGLHDTQMINMIYDASEAGVEIDLIVRGICCLVPNQTYSSNVKITRIVDSYLEHSRVWYFYAGGCEELYITSADWMRRNLSRRIETAFPVLDNHVKSRIINGLMIQLSDNIKACRIDENLSNIYKVEGRFENPVRAQKLIYDTLKKDF